MIFRESKLILSAKLLAFKKKKKKIYERRGQPVNRSDPIIPKVPRNTKKAGVLNVVTEHQKTRFNPRMKKNINLQKIIAPLLISLFLTLGSTPMISLKNGKNIIN